MDLDHRRRLLAEMEEADTALRECYERDCTIEEWVPIYERHLRAYRVWAEEHGWPRDTLDRYFPTEVTTIR